MLWLGWDSSRTVHCVRAAACLAYVGNQLSLAAALTCDPTMQLLPPSLFSTLPPQCNTFHNVDRFEGTQRSCRWQLERRRMRRRVAALASSTPQSEEAPAAGATGRRPRRAAALQHRHIGAAAADAPAGQPALDDSPTKRQRIQPARAAPAHAAHAGESPAGHGSVSCAASCAPAGGPAALWPGLGGAEQHAFEPSRQLAADAGRGFAFTSLTAVARAVAAARQQLPPAAPAPQPAPPAAMAQPSQPVAAPHASAARLLSSVRGLGSGEGRAQQPSPQPPSLASFWTAAPRSPTESEKELAIHQLHCNMMRLMREHPMRSGGPQPSGAPARPAALPLHVGGPGCYPPLALQIDPRPQMTKEEAQAQLATAAVVMAIALKHELAMAQRQQP